MRTGGMTEGAAAYLKEVLQRITLAGAAFLALIAVVPNFITGNIPGLQGNLAYFLGGTSVLIVVGVAMDMVDRLNAQLVMRNYEGFAKTKGGGGAGWANRKRPWRPSSSSSARPDRALNRTPPSHRAAHREARAVSCPAP